MNNKDLITAAINATKYSYSPYSKYKVGAAILTKNNKVYTGCNIENASYSATVCAERTAIFKAVSEGEKAFTKIAIVCRKDSDSSDNDYPSPCGVCRQVLSEFCTDDFQIILAKNEDDFKIYTLKDLLPHSFTVKNL
ncbi:MAG: cytidine deaminase [Eubacteriales bacterium]|nr:cytidine deaminase [Eubacteriales bacterium]